MAKGTKQPQQGPSPQQVKRPPLETSLGTSIHHHCLLETPWFGGRMVGWCKTIGLGKKTHGFAKKTLNNLEVSNPHMFHHVSSHIHPKRTSSKTSADLIFLEANPRYTQDPAEWCRATTGVAHIHLGAPESAQLVGARDPKDLREDPKSIEQR